MKAILTKYYFLVLALLMIGFFGKWAQASEIKIHYYCTSDKPLHYSTAEGDLPSGTELDYSPETGKSLNLSINRFPNNQLLWVRQGYKETRRFISILKDSKPESGEIELGEEGETKTAVYKFSMKDADDLISGSCEITAE